MPDIFGRKGPPVPGDRPGRDGRRGKFEFVGSRRALEGVSVVGHSHRHTRGKRLMYWATWEPTSFKVRTDPRRRSTDRGPPFRNGKLSGACTVKSNKRSSPRFGYTYSEGRDVFFSSSTALMCSSRTSITARWPHGGFALDEMSERFPSLGSGAMSGFGMDGPDSECLSKSLVDPTQKPLQARTRV